MSNIFAKFIFQSFNNVTVTSIFLVALKLANTAPVFKKTLEILKKTIGM